LVFRSARCDCTVMIRGGRSGREKRVHLLGHRGHRDESSMHVTSVLRSEAVPFSKDEEATYGELVKIPFVEIRTALVASPAPPRGFSCCFLPRCCTTSFLYTCVYIVRTLGGRRIFIACYDNNLSPHYLLILFFLAIYGK